MALILYYKEGRACKQTDRAGRQTWSNRRQASLMESRIEGKGQQHLDWMMNHLNQNMICSVQYLILKHNSRGKLSFKVCIR